MAILTPPHSIGRSPDLAWQRDFQQREIGARLGQRIRHAAGNGNTVVRRQDLRPAIEIDRHRAAQDVVETEFGVVALAHGGLCTIRTHHAYAGEPARCCGDAGVR